MLIWKSCALRKLLFHSKMGMKSFVVTSLVLVELLMLSFCLIELEITMPEPRIIQPPDCPLQLKWVPWEPLAYHLMVLVLSLCNNKGKSGIAQRYHII